MRIDLTNTAVTKASVIRDNVCLRPAMDFSDKLISNAIKRTGRCRTGIIYLCLKLIKLLLQKPSPRLYGVCVSFLSHLLEILRVVGRINA